MFQETVMIVDFDGSAVAEDTRDAVGTLFARISPLVSLTMFCQYLEVFRDRINHEGSLIAVILVAHSPTNKATQDEIKKRHPGLPVFVFDPRSSESLGEVLGKVGGCVTTWAQ